MVDYLGATKDLRFGIGEKRQTPRYYHFIPWMKLLNVNSILMSRSTWFQFKIVYRKARILFASSGTSIYSNLPGWMGRPVPNHNDRPRCQRCNHDFNPIAIYSVRRDDGGKIHWNIEQQQRMHWGWLWEDHWVMRSVLDLLSLGGNYSHRKFPYETVRQ